ncbi:MAG: PD40 domain-containing protein [Bryobacterales bacterium]|nr:PD40 domain-containing protein [Bryobacterales bacterium]
MNRIMITALAAALTAALWAAQGVPAEAQLQAAITKETVDGDLEQAINLYKKIVAAHAGNRAVTAQALLRMGQCYEKLGMAESRKAYERVVKEFSDQSAQAVMARERLAKLGHRTAGAGVAVRQVWTRPGLSLGEARIFPDGRRLAFIDWAEHDTLVVADMVPGEIRKLTSSREGGGAVQHAVSPDSKWIAYYWYLKNGAEVRVIGTDGSAPRTVYSNPEADVEPVAWFPDGKSLVAHFFRKDQTAQLAVISVADGKARVLKSGLWQQFIGVVSVSLDGRYLVYDFPSLGSAPERDIFLMAADGSSETALVRHPSDDTLLGWTPDGKYILFRSNRSGSMSIWLLPMSGNKPGGEPRQLKSNVGNIQPLGFDRNGSFYYRESTGAGREVYVAELDSQTGKMVATKLASTRHLGEKGVAAFSSDGKALVYQSGSMRDGGGPRTAKGITVRSRIRARKPI